MAPEPTDVTDESETGNGDPGDANKTPASPPSEGNSPPAAPDPDEGLEDVVVSYRRELTEAVLAEIPEGGDAVDLDLVASKALEQVAGNLDTDVPEDAQAEVVKALRNLAYAAGDREIAARSAVDTAVRVLTR